MKSGRLNWCIQFPYIRLERPDHEVWHPDSWTLYARLTLWRRASRREHTSSKQLQLSSCTCVLERNLSTCRTLKGVQPCCWDVRTDARWNSSKVLDTEEGPDGRFSSSERMMLGQLSVRTEFYVVRTVIRELNYTVESCTESSWSS
jgi:hypothetical protein